MRRLVLAIAVALTLPARTMAQQPMTNADAERRVEAILARLTPEGGGVNGFDIPGLARLGIPQLGTADGPFGVRADGPSTVYASADPAVRALVTLERTVTVR